MLYNKDYLFIHIPRSAGKCIKSAIIPFLEKPIYLSQNQINNKFFNEKDFININKSFVHFSLEEINHLNENKNIIDFYKNTSIKIKNEKLIKSINNLNKKELPDFKNKKIIICLRNPLDRAKSLYKFKCVKDGYLNYFELFTNILGKERFLRNTKSFFTINGEIPSNVEFIRFDSLENDLSKLFNINKIDVESKKHNQVYELNEGQKTKFFKVKDINKVISNINKWEEWSIQKGLLNPITEKDLLI
jgi:hypothetical protein